MLQFHERHRLIWDSNLTSTQKFILFAYDSYGDSQGESIYPSYNTIATKTSYTRRTVIDTVHKLCELGVMGKLHRLKDGGGMTSNRYKIYFQKLAGNSPGSDRNSPGSDPGSPDQSSYLSNDQFIDQKKKKPGKTRDVFSEISKFQDSDQNLENSNQNESQKLIPDQEKKSKGNPEKKESSGKERKDAPPQTWSEQQILSTWNANRPKSWLPYSIGTLISPAVQNGLDHILQNFGDGDRAKTCEIIAITLKYVSANDSWLSSQRFTAKQSLSLEHGAGNKRFLGDYVPAALQALEKAQKPQSVERSPLPLPTTSNNIFSAQIKELLNERCTEQ